MTDININVDLGLDKLIDKVKQKAAEARKKERPFVPETLADSSILPGRDTRASSDNFSTDRYTSTQSLSRERIVGATRDDSASFARSTFKALRDPRDDSTSLVRGKIITDQELRRPTGRRVILIYDEPVRLITVGAVGLESSLWAYRGETGTVDNTLEIVNGLTKNTFRTTLLTETSIEPNVYLTAYAADTISVPPPKPGYETCGLHRDVEYLFDFYSDYGPVNTSTPYDIPYDPENPNTYVQACRSSPCYVGFVDVSYTNEDGNPTTVAAACYRQVRYVTPEPDPPYISRRGVLRYGNDYIQVSGGVIQLSKRRFSDSEDGIGVALPFDASLPGVVASVTYEHRLSETNSIGLGVSWGSENEGQEFISCRITDRQLIAHDNAVTDLDAPDEGVLAIEISTNAATTITTATYLLNGAPIYSMPCGYFDSTQPNYFAVRCTPSDDGTGSAAKIYAITVAELQS